MNLSPAWVEFLSRRGFEARHWSTVGRTNAPDSEVMQFARDHGYAVFTHDLDFANILATTNALGPSVIQVRTQNPLPEAVGEVVLRVLATQADQISRGALVTIEPASFRIRVLPLRNSH